MGISLFYYLSFYFFLNNVIFSTSELKCETFSNKTKISSKTNLEQTITWIKQGMLPESSQQQKFQIVFNKLDFKSEILEQSAQDEYHKSFEALDENHKQKVIKSFNEDNSYVLPVKQLETKLVVLDGFDNENGFVKFLENDYPELYTFIKNISNKELQQIVLYIVLKWSILHEGYHLNDSSDSFSDDEAKAEIRSTLLILREIYSEYGKNHKLVTLLRRAIEESAKSEFKYSDKINDLGAKANLFLLTKAPHSILAQDTEKELTEFAKNVFISEKAKLN